jgi:hypothetical protein
MAIVVLTAHSALSAYVAKDDARLLALVAMGYLLMLALFFYALPVLKERLADAGYMPQSQTWPASPGTETCFSCLVYID